MGGHTANLEIDARYQYEGYINFNTTYSHGFSDQTGSVYVLWIKPNILLQTNCKFIR